MDSEYHLAPVACAAFGESVIKSIWLEISIRCADVFISLPLSPPLVEGWKNCPDDYFSPLIVLLSY